MDKSRLKWTKIDQMIKSTYYQNMKVKSGQKLSQDCPKRTIICTKVCGHDTKTATEFVKNSQKVLKIVQKLSHLFPNISVPKLAQSGTKLK